jgi:hypothetical protein
MEDLDFPDSKSETGLRIVDILLSTFCRALNGTLDERGWSMLGRVMTGTQGNRNRLVFLRTHPSEEVPDGRRRYGRILNEIESQRRDVFTPRRRRK